MARKKFSGTFEKGISKLVRQRWAVYALSFAAIGGIILLVTSHAATLSVSVNADKGQVLGSARVVADPSASDGNAVQYGTGAVTDPLPLPSPGSWTNTTNNLVSAPTECGTLTMMWPQPGTNRLLAGVAGSGLYYSDNFGASWASLSGQTIKNRPSWVSFDPAHSGTFYESGTWHEDTGSVFKTTDNGAHFTRLGNINSNGVDYVSIDYSDPNRQLLLAGPHETSKQVWKTTNGGASWSNIGAGIGGTGFTDAPLIIDSQTYLVNSTGSGIYLTTDGGASWRQVSSIAGGGYPPLVTSKGVIYYPAGDGFARSTNLGVTWTKVGSGFREGTPFELPDGRLVAIGGDHLMVSNADGTSWSQFGAPYPSSYNVGWPPVGGTIYSGGNSSFYLWHWDCANSMLTDSIMKLH